MRRRRALIMGICVAAAVIVAGVPPIANAAFPGQNGKLVVVDNDDFPPDPKCPGCDSNLFTSNSDGSARTRLTTEALGESGPQWSADGEQVVYSAYRDGNYDIYVIDGSGASGEQRLTTDPATDWHPAWTPDGRRIVFSSNRTGSDDLYVMNADGTGVTQLTTGPVSDLWPAVSPDGTRVAFSSSRRNPACTSNCQHDVYVMDIDGTDVSRVPVDVPGCWISEGTSQPDWSPDGGRLVVVWGAQRDCAWERVGPGRVLTVRPDGSDETAVRDDVGDYLADPAWSPDGTRILFTSDSYLVQAVDSDGGGNHANVTTGWEANWQPLPVNTPSSHVRPIAASPIYVSLVPAFGECTGAGNRTHGPPLVFASCAPPQETSPNLTVRVPGGDNLFKGLVRLAVRLGPPGGVDDTDVRLRVSVSHVMHASDFSEYTGELRATARVRVTDKEPPVSSTIQDFPLEFDVPCVSTPDPNLKSTCDVVTGLDAVIPGSSPEGTRAVWALDQVKVYDGGADEDGATEADNSLYAVQGIFVP